METDVLGGGQTQPLFAESARNVHFVFLVAVSSSGGVPGHTGGRCHVDGVLDFKHVHLWTRR